MTADEAKQALKEGRKVRLKNWPKGEYFREEVRMIPIKLIIDEHGNDEDGIYSICTSDDWEIVE